MTSQLGDQITRHFCHN